MKILGHVQTPATIWSLEREDQAGAELRGRLWWDSAAYVLPNVPLRHKIAGNFLTSTGLRKRIQTRQLCKHAKTAPEQEYASRAA